LLLDRKYTNSDLKTPNPKTLVVRTSILATMA